ncbi:MAG: ABC transporter permease [Eubacteriales bacterium]
MNFLKRSFTSIFRKPGKSVLLLLLVFLLCNVIAGAISVKNALNMTKRSLLEKMGAEVRIEIDYEWIHNNAGENFDWSMIKNIDKSTVDKLSQSPYVKRADYLISSSFLGVGLISANASAYDKDMIAAEAKAEADDMPVQEEPSYTPEYYFQLIGGSLPTLKDEEEGNIRLTEGRCYTQEELDSGAPVVLISANLANCNGLSVGDTITLRYTLYQWNETTYESRQIPCDKEFQIIGLFTPVEKMPAQAEENTEVILPRYNEYDDSLYTTGSAWTAFSTEIKETGIASGLSDEEVQIYEQVNASFLIDSIDNVEIFEIENKGELPFAYTFRDNSENLSEVAKPMENMKLIANIILYVAVGATVLILALLVTLFLKDRTREMGIYLSLGEKRLRIALQIFAEVMVIAVIAVSLSIFSGNILAKQLSSVLLENQLDTGSTGMVGPWYGGSELISGDDVIEEYDVTLNAGTIAFIYLVGLGSVFVSTAIPVVLTLRLKPRKILM